MNSNVSEQTGLGAEKVKIEILSVELLDRLRPLVEQFRYLSTALKTGLGWHYLLDLSWSASQLASMSGLSVLDAGAGWGLMQWWLADQGVNVTSVDRVSRYELSDQYRNRYRVKGWRGKKDLTPILGVQDFLPPWSPKKWHLYPRKLIKSGRKLLQSVIGKQGGNVFIYNCNLHSMTAIPDNSMDAVVSISALEHNTPNDLKTVVAELMRVLKPGGKLIATLGAAKDHDWFHEPSNGWCYTDATLREIFSLPADCWSNYDRYDELYQALCGCAELRDNLADFYFKSGENGMPWGIWEPQYQTVGVVKVKV